MDRGDLIVQVPSVNRQIGSLERAVNRLTGSVIFAALLLGGIVLYGNGNNPIAYILFGCSGLTLLWIIFFSRSGPRRFHP
jgi:hypothetical protein